MTTVHAPAPAFFFSDAHLGFDTPEAERAKQERLLRFLEMARASGRSLFCLGDLFEFWFEYETTIPKRFFTVLRRLQELSDSGVQLFFLGGNHDWWVRRSRRPGFLEQEIGFRVLDDGSEVATAGLRLLLFHGDGLGQGDLRYRALKVVLRNRLAIEAFRWVHPDLARGIGNLTSRLSRMKDGGEARPETCANIREFARRQLESRAEIDAVVAGHAHVPEETEFGAKRYLNIGDWINHATYAVAENGTLALRTFQPGQRGGTIEAPPVLLA